MDKNYIRQYNNCIICGKDISHSRRLKTCGCSECEKVYRKYKYDIPKEKICRDCGKIYLGTDKSIVCPECKEISLNNKKFKQIEQQVICKDCGKIIKTQIKNITNNIPEIVYELCDDCKLNHKKEFSKNASKRMKENNPMFDEEISIKVGNTLRKLYEEKCLEQGLIPKERPIKRDSNKSIETKEELIERMKEHNPMQNKDSVEKMKQTTKERILSGEIKYKRGKEHPLYKGNRTLGRHIRLNLSKWIKEQLDKSNYTCQLCGKTNTELHVHHNEPLRNIINNFLKKYNTTNEDILNDEILLNKFTDDIIKYHYNNKNIGIVVCPDCHNIIDKYYNRLTHYKHHKNEN